MRTRNLRRGRSEPAFETGLAEPCVIARNEGFLSEPRSRIARVRVSDHFAGIFEGGQAPPNQFIQTKLFRPSNFDGAIYRRAHPDPAYGSCHIVSSHRL